MYQYENHKNWVLSDNGQRQFLRIRDRVNLLLKEAGAISMGKATAKESGESWDIMACVDRLVELGEIREIARPECPAQYRVFVNPKE